MKNDEKFTILQIGQSNWKEEGVLPDKVNWQFVASDQLENFSPRYTKKGKVIPYNAIILTSFEGLKDCSILEPLVNNYALLYDKDLTSSLPSLNAFLKKKMAQSVSVADKTALIKRVRQAFYKSQSGIKLHVDRIDVVPSYDGKIDYQGHSFLQMDGEFGSELKPILTWRNNLYVDPDKMMELWLEYHTQGDIQVQLVVREIFSGATEDSDEKVWIFDEEAMQSSSILSNLNNDGISSNLSISLYAKGSGKLMVGDLHYRWSRLGFGKFVLGGHRATAANRQEFIYYFDPGDLKPPLNVYFSGYRSLEGFEGYGMMKKMGSPFILISDPRLEGGGFYIGDDDYEMKIKSVIQYYLCELGFSRHQLILSGISMGTFGALYYGSKLNPHAIIVGKPLVNIGTIATNNRLNRSDEFDTALDLLQMIEGEVSQESAQKLNQRFWSQFEKGQFEETEIAVAYMKNDDYDMTAFRQLVEHLQDTEAKIIGRGYLGRHNDNSPAIISWFLAQYYNLLRQDFGRKNLK